MADRFGPRLILTRIVLWWSVFTALTGAVSGFHALLLTRFCFGAGEAGAWPNAAASIASWFPTGERGRAFGFSLYLAMQVGGALSPLLVVPIQMHYGWRASFYLFALLGVAWAVVWFFWYRNTPRDKQGVPPSELDEIEATPGRHERGLPWRVAVRKPNFWAILLMGLAFGYGTYFLSRGSIPTWFGRVISVRENCFIPPCHLSLVRAPM